MPFLHIDHRFLLTTDDVPGSEFGHYSWRHETCYELCTFEPAEAVQFSGGADTRDELMRQGAPFLRVIGRLHDTAGEPLWPGFRRTATTDWPAPLEEGMRRLGRLELATVVLAVIRGLPMDLGATGDGARTGRAFREFVAGLDAG